MSLTKEQKARARSHMYQLLGRLFLKGVEKDTLPHIQGLAPLNDALEQWKKEQSKSNGEGGGTKESKGEEDWFDLIAADHQQLFSFQLFPYESIFLGEEQTTVGVLSQRLLDQYQHSGFPVATNAESPDHIGVELMFLAFLSKGEAEALASGNDPKPYLCATQLFLRHHLLLWLPSLVFAIAQTEQTFFKALAVLTLSFVDAHWSEEDSVLEPEEEKLDPSIFLPELTDKLDDAKTGLRDIAEYLLMPAFVGFVLTRGDIKKLSRGGGLPSGFGKRSLMLHNVMRSAAEYDGFPGLLKGLLALRERWLQMFTERRQAGGAWVGAVAELWIARLAHSHDFLLRLSEVVESRAELDG